MCHQINNKVIFGQVNGNYPIIEVNVFIVPGAIIEW